MWAEKWLILKAATILAGGLPSDELEPDALRDLCSLVEFDGVEWEMDAQLLRASRHWSSLRDG